jgi:trehalose 6-phosphate phosphatase
MNDLLSPVLAPVVRSLALPGTLVVLDFDGTLAPIVGDRRAARLSESASVALARLASRYPVAVLSGRTISDVRDRLAGVAVTWVVGSHGAEWPGEEGRHQGWLDLVAEWTLALTRRLSALEGVELEVKPLSLTVHYRHSPLPAEAEARIAEATADLAGAVVVLGKMVVNLLPGGSGDKGTALQRLVTLAGAQRVLFIGDDVTDEAAFGAALEIPSVMVRVGRHPGSLASAWLQHQGDVEVLLDRLSELRGGTPAP